jgi:hypothetical protein
MKRILISLFCVSAVASMIVSCGETYKESTGNEFQGTWVYVKTIPEALSHPKEAPVFMQIREIGGTKVMLFFTNARYDSSYVYMEEESRSSGATNLFAARVHDSVFVEIRVLDENDYPIKNQAGEDSIRSEWQILKPTGTIDLNSLKKEKLYFGTYSFETVGDSIRMHIMKYTGADRVTDGPLQDDIYKRP